MTLSPKPVVVEFGVTASVGWVVVPVVVKVMVAALEVATAYWLSAALVAMIVQVPAALAVTTPVLAFTTQPVVPAEPTA